MYNILRLKYFKTIVESESMNEAANKLFITQSALSQAICKLEKELDLKVFDRHSKKIVLNKAGLKLYELTNVLFNYMGQMEDELTNLKKDDIPTLTFVADWPIYLSLITTDIMNHYPNIKINARVLPQLNLNMLLNEKIDIMVGSFYEELFNKYKSTLNDKGIKYSYLLDEYLYFVIPKKNPLSHKKEIKLSDINSEKLVRVGEENCMNWWIDDYLVQNNCKLLHHQIIDGKSLEDIKYTTDYLFFTSSLFLGMPTYKQFKIHKALIPVVGPKTNRKIFLFYSDENLKFTRELTTLLTKHFYKMFI